MRIDGRTAYMKTKSQKLTAEQSDEKEWALECAVRILKRKHVAGTRHVQIVLTLEATVADLKAKLHKKDKLLKKITDSSWEVIPIKINQGTETLPDKVFFLFPVN